MSRPKNQSNPLRSQPLHRHSLRDQAAEVIRQHILQARLQPGASLPTERDLSHGLAVSRTVVREALTVLEVEGLLQRRPSSGYYVTDSVATLPHHSAEYIRQLLAQTAEMRAAYEMGVLHVLLPKVTDKHLADLEQQAAAIDEAMDQRQAHAEAELAFHVRWWAIAQNDELVDWGRKILGDYMRALALARSDSFTHPDDTGVSRHLPLVQALRTRDLSVVQAAMWQHVQLPKALLVSADDVGAASLVAQAPAT